MKFSFYEQVGILIPGALFVAALLILWPGYPLSDLKNISFGSLGIFAVVSYAAGHAIAATGNWIEAIWWLPQGGMPSDWLVKSDQPLLSDEQTEKLRLLIEARFGLQVPKIKKMRRANWSPIFAQIYRASLSSKSTTRIEVFNGNYGLNRGLMAACFLLAIISVVVHPNEWVAVVGFILIGCIYGYRMQLFAKHFAREVYLVFLAS